MDDFDEDYDRQIIDLFNGQQDTYMIISKIDLKSKNQLFIGYNRSHYIQKGKANDKKQDHKNNVSYNESKQIANLDFYLYKNHSLSALKLYKYHNKKQKNAFIREKNVLDLFTEDHEIIKYSEIFPVILYNRKHLLVSMQFYPNEDLLFYLWRPMFTFDEHFICLVAFKALKILQLLKGKKVVHNDIKFENFIVTSEYPFEIILTDFESAQIVNENDQSNISSGTSIFKAPEVLEKMPHDYKADLWSLGVNIFYHLYFEYPFNIQETENCSMFENVIKEKIFTYNIQRKENDRVSDDAWECITALLEKDPIKRITVEDALSLKWFLHIDENESKLDHKCNLNQDFQCIV